PAGATKTVSLTVRISAFLPGTVTSIVNDGLKVDSSQGVVTESSPHITPIAPAHAVSLSPATQTDGTRDGQSLDYVVHVHNNGSRPDSYSLGVSGNTFPPQVFDASGTTPLTTTPTVAPGATTDVRVRVTVPANAANATTDHATVTATSVADGTVNGSSTVN